MNAALSTACKFDDTIIKVDESLCIGCGNFVRTCPRRVDHQGQIFRRDGELVEPVHRLRSLRDGVPRRGHASARDGLRGRRAAQAATIALACVQLAAHALGLGSSWSGGINTAAQACPQLVEMLGLPEGTVSYGTILLGYSAESFARIPVRMPLDVTWQ